MKHRRTTLLCLLFALGCAEEPGAPPSSRAAAKRLKKRDPLKELTGFEKYRAEGEPDRVAVLDILISFRGADSKIKATYTKDEAETMADEVLRKFKTEKMDVLELAKLYSHHRPPATGQLTVAYKLTNYGVKPKPFGEYAREQLHTGWGDIAFTMPLRAAMIAPFNMRTSAVNGRPMLPDGWHVMYRIQ